MIRDDRFVSLCRSIEDDPAFMDEQPILAMADGTIYSGNQRYRAVEHLGWTTVPASLKDIPEVLAKRRGMVANNQWGDWIDDDLGNLLAELQAGATDLSLLGFEDGELERLLAQADGRVVDPDDVTGEWQGMPEFEQEDKTAFHTILVHFDSLADVTEFGELVQQAISDKTKFIWFPRKERESLKGVAFDES